MGFSVVGAQTITRCSGNEGERQPGVLGAPRDRQLADVTVTRAVLVDLGRSCHIPRDSVTSRQSVSLLSSGLMFFLQTVQLEMMK